jgi:hypothetical protein
MGGYGPDIWPEAGNYAPGRRLFGINKKQRKNVKSHPVSVRNTLFQARKLNDWKVAVLTINQEGKPVFISMDRLFLVIIYWFSKCRLYVCKISILENMMGTKKHYLQPLSNLSSERFEKLKDRTTN